MSVKVKICGATMPEQAQAIAALGADYIGGIIEFPKSPRSVMRGMARKMRDAVEGVDRRGEPASRQGGRPFARTQVVGVVVDVPFDRLGELIEETGIRILQLHGEETPEEVKRLKECGIEVWKAVTKENYTQYADIADRLLVDAQNPLHGAGGSGCVSDWAFAKQLVGEGYAVVLSGGLNSDNVQEGITRVQPFIVDASSGVESAPGIKDMAKVERFIGNARRL